MKGVFALNENIFKQLDAAKKSFDDEYESKLADGTVELLDKMRREAFRGVCSFIQCSRFCKTKSSRDFIETVGMTDSAAAEKLGLSKNTIRAKRHQYGAKLKAILGESFISDLRYGDAKALTRIRDSISFELTHSVGSFLVPSFQDKIVGLDCKCSDVAPDLASCRKELLMLALSDKYFIESLTNYLNSQELNNLAFLIDVINSGDKDRRKEVCFCIYRVQRYLRKSLFIDSNKGGERS